MENEQALADGVILGSAGVKIIGEGESPVEAAMQFAAEFRGALSKSLTDSGTISTI